MWHPRLHLLQNKKQNEQQDEQELQGNPAKAAEESQLDDGVSDWWAIQSDLLKSNGHHADIKYYREEAIITDVFGK